MDIKSLTSELGLGPSSKKKYNLGIALGGGGIRGYVHLGILKALNEQDIYPEIIAGTSAGALTGVFVAAGFKPEKVHELLKEKDVMDYSRFQWNKEGLLKLDGMSKLIGKHIEVELIEDLQHPFIATVSNLNQGCVEYLNKGEIGKVVLASASIPLIFAPIEMNGQKYADGGIFDNLPVKPLQELCDKTIGVSVSPIEETDELGSLVKIAARTFQLSVNAQNQSIRDQCTVFIEPSGISKYDLLDSNKADELFDIGYDHVSKMDVRQLLEQT